MVRFLIEHRLIDRHAQKAVFTSRIGSSERVKCRKVDAHLTQFAFRIGHRHGASRSRIQMKNEETSKVAALLRQGERSNVKREMHARIIGNKVTLNERIRSCSHGRMCGSSSSKLGTVIQIDGSYSYDLNSKFQWNKILLPC